MRFFALVLATASLASADPGRWEPEKTWALMAGVLEWKDPNLSPFPKKDRQDRALEAVLKKAGVPAEQIVFLEDKAATREAIQKSLRDLCGRAPEGSTLLFYFAGHGMQDDGGEIFLANYDADTAKTKATCVATSDVARIVSKEFKGSRVLLFADCCYSGGLSQVVHAFDKGPVSAACLTSATASNVSTAEWTFTASLVAVFGGSARADASGDGLLTLAEADAFVAGEMRFREGQLTRGARTPSFEAGFVVAAVDAGTKAKDVPGPWKVGDYCEVEWKKEWYRSQVVDGRDGEWRVHYLGWEDSYDEWVPAARMRKPQGIGVAGGDKVQVEWKKKWWPATVMQVEGDFAFVHYDGFGKEWDEWVTAKRLKKR
ncbi:MAG: caspase family protein [Planctomycetia bacterium]|nr:caspase family protein [Planctomycetia bacterium]